MAFGKPGRPPEDRLARQREIYLAVVPLLSRVGARNLSMREAARAACLSVGGLYHYFPTKRDLVLHGLDWDARNELCKEYRARIADLAGWDLDRYLELYLDNSVTMFAFVRPAVLAALDLGTTAFRAALDEGMLANTGELTETLRALVPELSDADLTALARSIRRVGIGVMFDREFDGAELRAQLRALIAGYTAGARAVVAAD